ncbi:MAG: acyl-CoA desaturase, partial [Gammaproteobacteria bacterium]|nr:acyl-CoA desaturase [Gammaproteobacteria bacterium]
MKGIDLKFQPKTEFHRALCDRVNQYFAETGRSRRSSSAMLGKTFFMLVWLAVSYILLVFVVSSPWLVALLATSMAFAIAGVGFTVQHDANHGAMSDKRWANRLAALSLDLIGGSSYLWRWRHNVLHHNFPNVSGVDDDINIGVLARVSPEQPRYQLHRFQHFYMWFLYGFVAFRWQLIYDFKEMAQSRIGGIDIPRANSVDTTLFAVGKAVFISLALVIPMIFNPIWAVLLVYTTVMFSVGVIIAVVFQLAHCVEEADFPEKPESNESMSTDWAEHQLRSSVDFARSNRVLGWYLGGLNFQVVHHLFPKICHVHYAALSKLVEETCRQYGIT